MPRFTRLTPEQIDSESQAYDEMDRQERRRAETTTWIGHDPDGQRVITEYFDDLRTLELMEKTAKQLARTTEAPTVERPDGTGHVVTQPTRIGRGLITLCDAFDPSLPERHRQHVFNPWIKAMLVALRHWSTGTGLGFGKSVAGVGVVPEDRDQLDRMARFVRRVCHSRAFERKLQDEQKLALQNFRSACMYMISLFARHSRPLILRIDLYYHGEGREWARTDEAKAAFERFVRMLRSGRIVPDVLGCLISCEAGPERGLHFHVLVALDGHKRKDTYGLTQAIGHRWIEDYTRLGRGAFFNCYALRDEYEYNGLGLVHISDWRKLIGLRRALSYMAKAEYLIKVKDDAAGKTGRTNKSKRRTKKSFRRGLIRHVRKKLGAPRQTDSEMLTVKRILEV